MLKRVCDVGDCENDALFKILLYDEDQERAVDDRDVCGAIDAARAVREWLKDLGDVESA